MSVEKGSGEQVDRKITVPEAIQLLERKRQELLVYGNDSGESRHIEGLIAQVRAGKIDPKKAVDEANGIYDSKNDL